MKYILVKWIGRDYLAQYTDRVLKDILDDPECQFVLVKNEHLGIWEPYKGE